MNALRRLFAPVLDHPWQRIDEETTESESSPGAKWLPLAVLVTCALTLTLQEYYGQHDTFRKLFELRPDDEYYQLKSYGWWAGWRVFGYVVLPAMVILAIPGQRLRDYYVSPRGFFKHIWLYVVLFIAFSPVLYLVSQTEAFQDTYPFYHLARRSMFDFVAWEIMYALQFLSLEFFFRGFLLQGLRGAMRSKAILVMIVPYCMIHYGKPLPETLGAIGAGLLLGTLAMRTRSIWGGVCIHVGVAISMDVLSMRATAP